MSEKITAEELIKQYEAGERDFRGADLAGASLDGANLEGASFGHCNLRGANLSGANLDSTSFHDADLSNADLSRATLQNAYLGHANLNNVNLSDAKLSSVMLVGANLRGADLSRAHMHKVDLSAAYECISVGPLSDGNELVVVSGFDDGLRLKYGRLWFTYDEIISHWGSRDYCKSILAMVEFINSNQWIIRKKEAVEVSA